MQYPTDDEWYYEQVDLGFNYRMTDIHAALGLSQLTRLHEYIDKRHEIAEIYDQDLKILIFRSRLEIPQTNLRYIFT